MRVVNITDTPWNWKQDPQYVYIGRPSIYGNPFAIGYRCKRCGQLHPDGGSTLKCYREYMLERIETDPVFKEAIEALRDKTLVCFCKPKPCHGDVIMNYLNSTDRKEICEWADGTWCFKNELWQMTHMSDDYVVKPYDKGE